MGGTDSVLGGYKVVAGWFTMAVVQLLTREWFSQGNFLMPCLGHTLRRRGKRRRGHSLRTKGGACVGPARGRKEGKEATELGREKQKANKCKTA